MMEKKEFLAKPSGKAERRTLGSWWMLRVDRSFHGLDICLNSFTP